ncbi:hypothetical protein JJJ17_02115 [Paracoccus caeni]|uniref:Transposase n=1 Tax=Paracoccus caeni TaxID=657651 RepID=A0A934SGE7_9RHOB|nr:hypothetical protein [Paracoccus caeni]MBK4214714.1 hypothetical protein [Paracoccus caeni]
MTKIKYAIPRGARVAAQGLTGAVYPVGDHYRLVDDATGSQAILSYTEVVQGLNMPGAPSRIALMAQTEAAARIRQGGRMYRYQLSEKLRDQIDFRKALMVGIEALIAKLGHVRATDLNRIEHRRFVREIAQQLYTRLPIDIARRGGSVKEVAIMPKGRTMLVYYTRYRESGGDEMSLVDQVWLRGNRTGHGICDRMRHLMTLALEQAYLDTKKPTIAAALKKLCTLIVQENDLRQQNGQKPFALVDHKTLSRHMKKIGSTAISIARDGERSVANNRSRGTTDTRALFIGELVEVDECKLSLITVAKKHGFWAALSENDKQALAEIEDVIRTRLYLVLMLDVASRMPLAWVLTDAPSEATTRELIRMATRDKTREKIRYGCECDPLPAIGLACFKADNGTGIRNVGVKQGLLGIRTHSIDARTYHSIDKPYVERMFGTIESTLINLIHGYTGRKAGALPGYDALRNGVLDCEELYGIITRYLIDEYPNERHFGTNMMGQRPIDRAAGLIAEEAVIVPPSAHDRRIHLGWMEQRRMTDEGIKAFGLPFNSVELQQLRDHIHSRVAIYVDPDCIRHATVLIENHREPVLVDLSWTEMQDLTLPQFLAVLEQAWNEDPQTTHLREAQLARVRARLSDQLEKIALERGLARSFMTVDEAQTKAARYSTGVHVSHPGQLPGTLSPDDIALELPASEQHRIGRGHQPPIEGGLDEKEDRPNERVFIKPDSKGKLT